MENSGYGFSTQAFPDRQGLIPPYSPVVFELAGEHPYPFNIDFSRDPARVRTVFNAYVHKTKEMNSEKPDTYSGKRKAQNLGLKVDIDQAKRLHWRSIQARQPVVLTDSPNSPFKTPRRPANDYPSAEGLCAKNMIDAQKKQDYFESYRWSVLAERERAISKWEAEQIEASRVRQETDPTFSNNQFAKSPSLNLHETSWADPVLENTLIPSITNLSPAHLNDSISVVYRMGDPLQNRVAVDIPLSHIDGSQRIRSEPRDRAYDLPFSNGINGLFPQVIRSAYM
ncbi:hypothetical protein M0805_007682 [Coniferiporia weirii]|nr:hypothetical protein M0805_007682 [Coniferiporia weirii]